MRELVIDSPAKINLALEVLNKRDDGYHNIETIFQEIDLKDKIYIRKSDSLEIHCDNKLVPLREENLVYKAWDLLRPYKEDGDDGVRIVLEKNIPIAAGLAGGSSNAASTLMGLNDLWELGLSKEELARMGTKIGADVPYFIYGKTAFANEIGNEIRPLPSFAGRHVLLVNTGYGVSTQYIYQHIDLSSFEGQQRDMTGLIEAIKDGDDERVYPLLTNRLEDVTFEIEPDIKEIKEAMLGLGARASLMCGSGPTVFGIFENRESLEKAYVFFSDKYDIVYAGETI